MSATNKLINEFAAQSLLLPYGLKALKVVDHEDPSPLVNELLVWVQQTGFLCSLAYSNSANSDPFSKSSSILRFSLSDFYKAYFPLLRGLVTMGTQFYFRADIKAKAFSVEIKEDQLDDFKTYMKYILAILKAEIDFTKTLKAILLFDEQIASKQKALQSKLNNSLLKPAQS